MNEILKLFFSLSVSASIIVIILFLTKPLYKDRLSKTWQYYIWFVVIVRLLLPFSLQINSVQIPTNTWNMVTENNIQDVQPVINTQNPQAENQINDVNDIINNLWLVWLAVAIMLFVRTVTSFHGFVRYIKAGRHRVTDNAMLTIYDEVCILAEIKKPIGLYTHKLASSPMLVGFVKPFIVLPDIQSDKMELHNILLHEFTHYKRLDIFYKWLVQLVVCLHWFNPLVYFISHEVNKNCELSCDEMIIKKLDDKGKRNYGDTLLASLKFNNNYTNAIISITLNEDARLLKDRLGAIMKFNKKSKFTVVFSFVFALMIFCGSAFTGVYAANDTSIASVQTLKPKDKEPLSHNSTLLKTVDGSSYDNVTILANNSTILIEKSDSKDFNFYYIGATPDAYQFSAVKLYKGTLCIDINPNSTVTKNFSNLGVIKILIPDKLYSEFILKVNGCTVTRPTIDGNVNVEQKNSTIIDQANSMRTGNVVLKLHNQNSYNISESGSFQAENNQTLNLAILSNIKGGTVDLFLFDPNGKEQRVTIGSENTNKEITLSKGVWQYNCTGMFKDGGSIKITGTIK